MDINSLLAVKANLDQTMLIIRSFGKSNQMRLAKLSSLGKLEGVNNF
jgi:hypothetical protein